MIMTENERLNAHLLTFIQRYEPHVIDIVSAEPQRIRDEIGNVVEYISVLCTFNNTTDSRNRLYRVDVIEFRKFVKSEDAVLCVNIIE